MCFQDEAKKIKKEASDLDKLIDKTEKEYNDLRDDLKGKEQEVRKLLDKGKSEQQVRRPQPRRRRRSLTRLTSKIRLVR